MNQCFDFCFNIIKDSIDSYMCKAQTSRLPFDYLLKAEKL